MSKKKVVYHNRVTMNDRLAVVLGNSGEAWSTIVEGPKAIVLATDRHIVEAVLTGDLHKAVSLWNEVSAEKRETYDPDTSELSLKVKWVKIGQLFRIVWNGDREEEVIEDYNPSEWHMA